METFIQQQTQPQILREQIIIYLDLSSKIISKKELTKAIDIFVRSKYEVNPHHQFSVFFFNEDQSPEIIENLNQPKLVKKAIEQAYKERAESSNFFENGLFFCLSSIAAAFLKQAITFRVVVISDLPSSKSDDYTEALMNLVETVRTFPTFIDIIRIGNQRLYKDDVKLRLISTLTNGGLFYVESAKEMQDSLRALVKNKVLPDLRPEGGQAISEEHGNYYEELAQDLVLPEPHQINKLQCTFCEHNLCQYCNESSDKVLICPSCGTGYHECCSSLYSWKHNIGLPHIFRCTQCNGLIKLDKTTVYAINGIDLPDAHKELSVAEIEEEFQETETWTPEPEEISIVPSFSESEETKIQEEDIPTIIEEPKIEEPLASPKKSPPRMGLFGPVHGQKAKPIKSELSTATKDEIPTIINKTKESISVSELRARRQERRKKRDISVVVCPVCSTYVKGNVNVCPKCGCPVR